MTRIADLADRIAARQQVYRSAYNADLDRLRRQHGHGPVSDALRMLERRNGSATLDRQNGSGRARATWDSPGHARAVARGIDRVVAERRLTALADPYETDLNGWSE